MRCGRETAAARSWPAISGRAAIRSAVSSGGVPSVTIAPRIAPRSRRWRTSARVSMPVTTGHAGRVQPVDQAPPARRRRVARLAADERAHLHAVGLPHVALHAVVADHRRRERQDLTREARVGEALLVAGHAGREHDLAQRQAGRRAGLAVERRPSSSSTYAASCRAPRRRRAGTRPDRRPPSGGSGRAAGGRGTRCSRSATGTCRPAPSTRRRDPTAPAPRRSPTASRGAGSANARAGPTVIAVTTVASGSTPGSTRPVRSAANAVSRPVTPFGACSNGCSFSSSACGAWSVAITSTRPDADGLDQRLPVVLGRPAAGSS